MVFVLTLLVELIAGGFLGAVGFIMIHATYDGPVDAVFIVFRLLGYTFGVFMGIITVGGLSGRDGNALLTLLGAAVGAVLFQYYGSDILEQANTLPGLLEAAFLSFAVLGPALGTLGYNLGLVKLKFPSR